MLRKTSALIATVILALSASFALAAANSDSVSGNWNITFKMGEHTGEGTMSQPRLNFTGMRRSQRVLLTARSAHSAGGVRSARNNLLADRRASSP